MGYFIAYRHTGADPEELEQLLPKVREVLVNQGQEVYCTYFDEDNFRDNGYGPGEIMRHAFKKIETLGNLLVVVDSSEKSEGMIMEVGYCLAKKIPVIVAKRKDAATYIDKVADKSFEYESVNELVQKIKEMV